MRWLVLAVLACCGSPPPPKPPAAEIPVHSLADVAGSWVTSDDLDWGYMLKIQPDGDVQLTVDRGQMGRCGLHATAVKGSTAPKFELEVQVDECHRDRANGPLYVTFPSLTNAGLVLEITDGARVERRSYSRLVQ